MSVGTLQKPSQEQWAEYLQGERVDQESEE